MTANTMSSNHFNLYISNKCSYAVNGGVMSMPTLRPELKTAPFLCLLSNHSFVRWRYLHGRLQSAYATGYSAYSDHEHITTVYAKDRHAST